MSGSQVGDEPQFNLEEQLASYQTELTAIASLLPSDSPRLAGENEEHTRTLAESEAPLPPIVVHRSTRRIVDGMHRLRAALIRGETHIEVLFVEGSAEDVFVLAVKLNAEHGMPLSRKDRVSAALRILQSHPDWSDRRIAVVTRLAPSTVAALRTQASPNVAQLTLRTGRDGRNRPVNGAAGRLAASRIITETPNASLREIANRAGIAVATARDVRNRMRLGQDPVPARLRLTSRERPALVAPAPPDPAPVGPPRPPQPDDIVPTVAPPAPPERVLSSMRRDPSLRMNQVGRTLLHLLGVNLLTPEQRQNLVDGVPAHRAADVVHAARLCAEQWLQFAKELEHRTTDHTDPSGPLPEPTRIPSLYASR